MIRVIAGKYGSRILKTLDSLNTRPTSVKVRGAIFSSLGSYFEGGYVLDLFAGSGAFGIEALSRGFNKAYFGDNSIKAINIVKNNLMMVEEDYEVIKGSYKEVLLKLQTIKFDLIFLDPPYKMKVMEEILTFINDNGMLNKNGTIVCETLKEDNFSLKEGLKIIKSVEYGISKITYIQGE